MNLRRLRVGEWIAALSGIALLISLVLPWWSLPGSWPAYPGSLEAAYFEHSPSGSTSWTAWQIFSVTDILLASLGVLAVISWVVVASSRASSPGVAMEALLTPFAVAMAVVALVQVIGVPSALDLPPPAPDAALEHGAWLGLAATLGVLAGVLLALRDERLSRPGRLTDQTGAPTAVPTIVETLPGPPSA